MLLLATPFFAFSAISAFPRARLSWHGSQFDVRSGRVEQGPAHDSITTYRVEERDGRVYVVLDR